MPIIALPSTTTLKDGTLITRIAPMLKQGAGVVTSLNHVHYVVTEYGVADLYGKSIRQRAHQLINVEHPNFRADLEKESQEMGQHHLDVCGEGAAIERRHLLRLAEEGGVPRKRAEEVIERMLLQASSLGERLERAPIRQMLAQQIKSTIDACRRRLES